MSYIYIRTATCEALSLVSIGYNVYILPIYKQTPRDDFVYSPTAQCGNLTVIHRSMSGDGVWCAFILLGDGTQGRAKSVGAGSRQEI